MRRFVILALIAMVVASCGGGEGADVTSTPSTAREAPASVGPTVTSPAEPEISAMAGGWQRVATFTEEPWIEEINGAAALPGGGFVAATASDPTVMWSPNGVSWVDGDPDGMIESRTVHVEVVGDRVVLLGSDVALWIGDPTTGIWEEMVLETEDLGIGLSSVSMTSNDRAVLIAAEVDSHGGGHADDAGGTPEIAVWLIDPEQMNSTRTTLSVPAARQYPSPSVTWFDGRWLMTVEVEHRDAELGEPVIEDSLWTSPDGVRWSQVEISPEFGKDPRVGFIPGRTGIVATAHCPMTAECGGIWFSRDGVDWSLLTDETSNGGVFSEVLGFVLSSHRISPDGSMLEPVPMPQRDFTVLTASNGSLLGVDGWGPPEERDQVDLWLYREPTAGWRWTVVDEPWAESVVDVAALPEGGFLVAATGEWSVLWSPDGTEWHDADPQREVTVLPLVSAFIGTDPQVITSIGDRVVVLDATTFGIEIGDVAARTWETIEFETSDLTGNLGLLMVAANEERVLVIGYEDDYDGGPLEDDGGRVVECGEVAGKSAEVEHATYLAWIVDPRSGDVERYVITAAHEEPAGLLAGSRACRESYGSAAWFKGRWVLNLAERWFVSPDGATWTQSPMPVGSGPATLMAGPDTLLATTWNGLWYSENGTDWTVVSGPDDDNEENDITRRGPSDATAYSESFGYVATPWSDPGVFTSRDGRTWEFAGYWPDIERLVASGHRAFAVGGFDPAYLFEYTG